MADVRHALRVRGNPQLVNVFWDAKAKRPGWKAAVQVGVVLTHYDLPFDLPRENTTEAERRAKALVRRLKREQKR